MRSPANEGSEAGQGGERAGQLCVVRVGCTARLTRLLVVAWKAALGHAYAFAGRTANARRILAELEAEPPSSWNAIGLADVHTAPAISIRRFAGWTRRRHPAGCRGAV